MYMQWIQMWSDLSRDETRLYFEIRLRPCSAVFQQRFVFIKDNRQTVDKIISPTVKSCFSCFLWVDINVTDCVKWRYDIISYRSQAPVTSPIENRGRLCDIDKYRIVLKHHCWSLQVLLCCFCDTALTSLKMHVTFVDSAAEHLSS